MFSPYEYTWISPGKGALQFGAFVLTFLGVCYMVKLSYPDRPSYPRDFEGGLEKELGGKGAIRVSLDNAVNVPIELIADSDGRREWRAIPTRREARSGLCTYTRDTQIQSYFWSRRSACEVEDHRCNCQP